jgi:mRNA interferase RelE/StbE
MVDDDPSDETSIEIQLLESLHEGIERSRESLGYGSREEFLRDLLADAVAHPEFDRGDLRAMLASEVAIQEGRTHGSAEVAAEVGVDRPDGGGSDWDWVLAAPARADLDGRDDYARERIVTTLEEIVGDEWRDPTEDLEALAEAPHDKLLIGPFRLGCRVDADRQLLYVLRITVRGS